MNKDKIIKISPIILTILHTVLSFFTDRLVFDALQGKIFFSALSELKTDSITHYILCKVIFIVAVFYLWHTVIKILYELLLNRTMFFNSPIGRTLKFAAIYFIPIIAVLLFKLPEGFLSNDEALIFSEASSLATYTWFYYLTTYYYIVTMMLIPSMYGPILVKVFLQVIVCGYCVHRFTAYCEKKKFLKKVCYLIYLPFFLPPVLAYTTSAHRIPVYYLLYTLLLFILFMDLLKKITPSKHKIFWCLLCGSVLTQWRTEGIYLIVFIPLLVFTAYPYLFADKKKCLLVIASFFIIQYLITLPQNGLFPDRLSAQADNRMGPFWAYTVTNMYRNGLDLDKNSESMEKIWRYLDRDTLQAINDDLKDINYEDVLILYYPGYTGVIETATPEDYVAYVEGCKELFISNIPVLLKTRIGSFLYAALPYSIKWDQGGIKGFALFLISIVKTIAYCLLIPFALTIIIFFTSGTNTAGAIIKNAANPSRMTLFNLMLKEKQVRLFTFLSSAGLMAHFFIVFILAPASYFKYYFPIYMFGYFAMLLIQLLKPRS